jgi:hypothetical protein
MPLAVQRATFREEAMRRAGFVMMLGGFVLMMCGLAITAGNKKAEPTPTSAPPASSQAATPPAPSASQAAAPSGPFEGEIVLQVKDEAAQELPPTITYDVKGDKVRYVPASANIRAVSDAPAQHVYAINETQKTFQEVDTKPAADKSKAPPEPKVNKTGKTEKVAGMDCENWTIDSGDAKADVCAAKGIAFFELAREPKPGSAQPPWAATLAKENAFPLRVVMHDKGGKEQYRAEATKVDRKKLDDSLFQLPATFKKADLATDLKAAALP